MARFFHVVGVSGSGKSSLILAMANRFEARGVQCAGQDPNVCTTRAEALSLRPEADVYFVEHMNDETLDALPGETVIRISTVAGT